jgi:hypothetical protein
VLVVIKFPAVTPTLSSFIPGGVLYLKQYSLGNELYF